MPSEISTAFDYPEARSAADPADRISLRDYVVDAEIGAFQLERGLTQRLRFNMVVELAEQKGAATDDVDLILSYDKLSEAIDTELAAERLNLLETLAERIAARVLREPQAGRVFLRIEKLDRGPWVLGVEIVRSKAEAAQADDDRAPQPVVVHWKAVVPDLTTRLDRLLARAQPVIITLGLPEIPRPMGYTPGATLRIDLLAIEQAAWALASRDERLSVVATRTEIDWALRRGKPIVWAPSKLVLDMPGAPTECDGFRLAEWLALELGAQKILVHGTFSTPAESRVPVESL